MKQVIQNSYLKSFIFSSKEEASTFLNNQKANHSLSLEDTFGRNYYCYVCYHSLTNEKLFTLSFSSDENESNLGFLFWNDCYAMDTGTNIYLIDERLNIKASFKITTSLVGMYIISNEKLLLLEEAYMRVIDYDGQVLQNEIFDLIESFSIKDNTMTIETSDGKRVIELV